MTGLYLSLYYGVVWSQFLCVIAKYWNNLDQIWHCCLRESLWV